MIDLANVRRKEVDFDPVDRYDLRSYLGFRPKPFHGVNPLPIDNLQPTPWAVRPNVALFLGSEGGSREPVVTRYLSLQARSIIK